MKNIVLIGFMGSGKTTVGEVLSRKLGRVFVDCDTLIEKRMGQTIAEIFAQKGEGFFRELERGCIEEVCQREDQVIACGGGAVLDPQNVERLKRSGLIFLLSVPLSVLEERLALDQDRPLLQERERGKRIRRLWEEREKRYLVAADQVVEAGNLSAEEIADLIIRNYRKLVKEVEL